MPKADIDRPVRSWFLGMVQRPPPLHQLGLEECCKLPVGPGAVSLAWQVLSYLLQYLWIGN